MGCWPDSSEEIGVLSQPSRRVFVSILTHRVTKREMYIRPKRRAGAMSPHG